MRNADVGMMSKLKVKKAVHKISRLQSAHTRIITIHQYQATHPCHCEHGVLLGLGGHGCQGGALGHAAEDRLQQTCACKQSWIKVGILHYF